MSTTSRTPKRETHGLSGHQWALLLVSFFLGVVCVFAVDHLFLSEVSVVGSVQAATETP